MLSLILRAPIFPSIPTVPNIIIIIIMFNHQYLKQCVQSEVVYRDDTCTIQKVKHKHNGYKQEQGCGVHGNTVQLHI